MVLTLISFILLLSACGKEETTITGCINEQFKEMVIELLNDKNYTGTDTCYIEIENNTVYFIEYNDRGEVDNIDWYKIDDIIGK